MLRVFFLALLLLPGLDSSAEEPFDAFLTTHCLKCHGAELAERDLRVDNLSRDFRSSKDSHLWAEVLERINAGEMPPPEEKQPTREQISRFVDDLDQRLKEGRAVRMARRPAVAHYRLSRVEYQNTVYDLLGVRYDPSRPGELNEDIRWHGFERIGSQLTLSPSHVERYYSAAKTVLSRAFPEQRIQARSVRKTAAELRYGGGKQQQQYLDRLGIKRPLRSVIFPGRLQAAFQPHWFGKTGPEHSGLYHARMQVSGVKPSYGQTPHLRIGKRMAEATNEGLVELDIVATEDEPEVVEFDVYLDMPTKLDFNVVVTDIISRDKGGHHRNVLSSSSYVFTHTSETTLLNPTGPQLFDENGEGIFSFVLLDWIEWTGPLVSQVEQQRRRGVLPAKNATRDEIEQALISFAEKAWRRPVKRVELKPYLDALESDRKSGESVQSAFRLALTGLLTSRHFTYLVEGDLPARSRVNDWELASRLSYFLWSSMPDDRLFSAAKSQKLSGDSLEEEVDRMLADDKIDRFVSDFSRQWLQLHRLGMFPPDGKLYPSYDVWLQESMRREAIEFFGEVFQQNQSIGQFIDSDWTMANPRLCEFYGLAPPTVSGFHRVSLKPDDHRGGLLTTGAVLGLTSDGTRHRPVHRGVWVSEAFLGKTPPPPPANVDPIEPNPPESPKSTVRQKLSAHTQNANCAACHSKIDPLGLAFDQFDAIGQWRERERVLDGVGEDPLVDASGQLPDGSRFTGAREFKQLLLNDKDRFLTAFVEHLCTYALRRTLTLDDREDLDAIVERARMANYRLKDIVKAVAISELIKKR